MNEMLAVHFIPPTRRRVGHLAISIGAWVLASVLLVCSTARAGIYGSDYADNGRCGVHPRVSATTMSDTCIGIVAGPDHGLEMPRAIIQLDENQFLITDMASWGRPRDGRLISMTVGPNGAPEFETVFSGLNYPHGLAIGPDKRVYVGEQDRVWRFSPADPSGTVEVILSGLPSKSPGHPHLHPLSSFVFDNDGNLILNLGSFTDRCETDGSFPAPCSADSPESRDAQLWILTLDGPNYDPGAFRLLAQGLRNSLALAVHPTSGLIVQAENNIDIWKGTVTRTSHDEETPLWMSSIDPERPAEELNIVQAGKHYGWPYCVEMGIPLPLYRDRVECSEFTNPSVLLPAHAAPFGMAYYTGLLFPELQGKLVVTFHGRESNGHRIVAYDVDYRGVPERPPDRPGGLPGFPLLVLDKWYEFPNERPEGRPSGLLVANDGRIWFLDYTNKTVMVLMRD